MRIRSNLSLRQGALAGALLIAATAAAAPAGAQPANDPPPYDSQWLQQSIAGDHFEIQAAKLAVKRSHNGHLGALAGRLLSDHAKSLKEATALARRLGVPVKAVPLPTMQWVLRTLQAEPNDDQLAQQYVRFEIAAHNQAIVEAGREIENGANADAKALADKESIMLSKHLRLARHTLRTLPAHG
jgi:putative membrane protein